MSTTVGQKPFSESTRTARPDQPHPRLGAAAAPAPDQSPTRRDGDIEQREGCSCQPQIDGIRHKKRCPPGLRHDCYSNATDGRFKQAGDDSFRRRRSRSDRCRIPGLLSQDHRHQRCCGCGTHCCKKKKAEHQFLVSAHCALQNSGDRRLQLGGPRARN
jgi:hypothetical protein